MRTRIKEGRICRKCGSQMKFRGCRRYYAVMEEEWLCSQCGWRFWETVAMDGPLFLSRTVLKERGGRHEIDR